MEVSQERSELLLAAAPEAPLDPLVDGLAQRGIDTDIVSDLTTAREVFLTKGGHCALVLSSSLTPAVAKQIVQSLTSVDPELQIIAFGAEVLRNSAEHSHVRRINFHPTSRAALGAIIKALRDL